MASPFARNQEGQSKGSGKKVLLMLLLGGVLAGCVWYNWNSLRPRAADASNTAAGGDAPADANAMLPDNPESIELALAALAEDPTAKLLRGHDAAATTFDKPPPNPFALARKRRNELVKPAPVVAAPVHGQPVRQVAAFDASQINLQSIFGSPAKRFALVNGKPVTVGAVVAGARIVSISDKVLVVQPLNDPDGPPVEILLKH